VTKYVKEETTKYGIPKVELFFLEPKEGKSTYQLIKHHLQHEAQNDKVHGYIDFIAVGNGGMRFDSTNSEHYLGSVANAVIRAKQMNILFVP
jgi:hypothetical protein